MARSAATAATGSDPATISSRSKESCSPSRGSRCRPGTFWADRLRYTPPTGGTSMGRRPNVGRGEGATVTEAATEIPDPAPDAATSPVPGPGTFSVFRKRDFRLLWSAQLVSTIGTALTDLAAGILVFRLTGSAASVGLMFVATAV